MAQFFSLLSSLNRLEAGKRLDAVSDNAMVTHPPKEPRKWKEFITSLQNATQVEPSGKQDDSEQFVRAMKLGQVF